MSTAAPGAPRAARKSAPAKKPQPAPTKDSKGGPTAAGRKAFAKSEGAHLKPGVRKAEADMTPEEMKRKGSWAVRFYGREGDLPPLIDAHGKPTRFALTATAWGEPVFGNFALLAGVGERRTGAHRAAGRRVARRPGATKPVSRVTGR